MGWQRVGCITCTASAMCLQMHCWQLSAAALAVACRLCRAGNGVELPRAAVGAPGAAADCCLPLHRWVEGFERALTAAAKRSDSRLLHVGVQGWAGSGTGQATGSEKPPQTPPLSATPTRHTHPSIPACP